MTRVIDFFVELLERLGRFFGVLRAPADPFAERRSRPGLVAILRLAVPALIVALILHFVIMTYRFAFWRGVDMAYPTAVLAEMQDAPPPAAEASATAAGQCAPSRTVAVQIHLIDMLVNLNDWAPATPQYTIGVFGLLDWADTPFYDNKASFQLGALTMLRRFSLDLADSIGRVRGTSGADADLQGASSRLRVSERAWVFNNPFDRRLQTFTTSAASSFRGAIPLYRSFNERLASCDALFDTRADNLRGFLDRVAADLGDIGDRLQRRSRAEQWSVSQAEFVPADGNDRGWFDMRADNLFHEARGELYALHGLMQAVRVDFADTVARNQLGQVWDRMEAHIAEGARLNPLIVSNGAEDGILTPDHLSVMSEKVLRARANMTELRDILGSR